jgi:hypothetical protein
VLVSHKKKFIYLKTVKTAGTSVEIFFEEFCTPKPRTYAIGQHHARSRVSKFGIVGTRDNLDKFLFRPKFYNHMPADELRQKLGEEVWGSYFKFAVCRNPFDALVSQFWFFNRSRNLELLSLGSSKVYLEFRNWLSKPRNNPNSHIYLLDGVPAVDKFIRYENLNEDIGAVCQTLGISKDVSSLQAFNSGIRPKSLHFGAVEDYYDEASIEIVKALYPFELGNLGYSLSSNSGELGS